MSSRCAAASGFAFAVSGVMLSEQTLLNAAVLTVDITSVNTALAGIVFNVLLIARAPLQLFQAIQTSLLPHLTGLEATEGHDAFARAIRVTVLAIAAFAVAVALGLLAIGPPVMKALFGQNFEYGRVGLALIGLGMGMHLTSGALNQAALARNQARTRGHLLDRGGRRVRRLDADAVDQRRTAAHRDRLPRRDEPAGVDARRRIQARHASRLRGRPRPPRSRDRRRRDREPRRRPSRPRTGSRPLRGTAARCAGSTPPSTSSATSSPRMWRSRSIFSSECSMNGCPPQPGLTGHAQREVDRVSHLRKRANGRGGVDRDTTPRPTVAHETRGVCDVRRCLGVERDRVGARLDELGDVTLRTLDHQMHVEQAADLLDLLAQRGDDQRADRDRRHEMTVHHVDVDHTRARRRAPLRPARPAARSRLRGSKAPRAPRAGSLKVDTASFSKQHSERAGRSKMRSVSA